MLMTWRAISRKLYLLVGNHNAAATLAVELDVAVFGLVFLGPLLLVLTGGSLKIRIEPGSEHGLPSGCMLVHTQHDLPSGCF